MQFCVTARYETVTEIDVEAIDFEKELDRIEVEFGQIVVYLHSGEIYKFKENKPNHEPVKCLYERQVKKRERKKNDAKPKDIIEDRSDIDSNVDEFGDRC